MPRNQPSSTPWLALAAGMTGWLLLGASRQPRAAPAAGTSHGRLDAKRRRRSGERLAGQSGGDRLGHDAAEPQQIPAPGWWEIIKRTVKEASRDRLLTEAAGITFYTLLALFPGLAALISIYGLVADPGTVGDQIQSLAGVVPGGGMEIIEEQVKRVTSKSGETLGFSAVFGLLVSLWSANAATKAMFDALNVVYEEEEKRSFFKLTLMSLAFTLSGLIFAVFAMAGVLVLPVLLNFVGLGAVAEWALRIGRWPLLIVLMASVLGALYRFGPSRRNARWKWVTWGSAFASVAWLIASLGFSWYVASFGNYNATYGSLGAVIGFMTWIWISAAVVLAGGELNAEMERQTARDTTTGPEKPMGLRGATMADQVARP